MQRLSDADLNAGSPLGRLLIQALRAGRVSSAHTEEFANGIAVRFPAVAPQVGDLVIVDDGEEYTLYLGHHTHTHFMPALIDAPGRSEQEHQALDDLLEYLDAILKDEVVIWSEARGSGGTFGSDVSPNWLASDAQAWLWSGKPHIRV